METKLGELLEAAPALLVAAEAASLESEGAVGVRGDVGAFVARRGQERGRVRGTDDGG